MIKFVKSQKAFDRLVSLYSSPENVETVNGILAIPGNESTTSDYYLTGSDIVEMLNVSEINAIEVEIPEIEISLENHKTKRTAKASFSVDVYSVVQLNKQGNEIAIKPYDAVVREINKLIQELLDSGLFNNDANSTDSLAEDEKIEISYKDFFFFLINDIIVPILLENCGKFIPKFKIPDLQLKGETLSDLNVSFVSSNLVVSANIKKVPKSEETDKVQLLAPKGEGFSVDVSQNFVQTVCNIAIDSYGKISGEGKESIMGYKYSLTLSNPDASISNNSIKFGIDVKGDFNAEVDVWLFEFGLMAKGESTTKPYMTGNILFSDDNEMILQIGDINNFTLRMRVAGSIPLVPGFVINLVLDLLGKLGPRIIKRFIIGKQFKLFKIPTFEFQFSDLDIKTTMNNLSTRSIENRLTLSGDIDVAVEKKYVSNTLLGAKDEYIAPGQCLGSNNGKYYAVYQDDGDVVLYRTLTGQELWSSAKETEGKVKTPPQKAIMQRDGNFVIYANGQPIFSSNTYEKKGIAMILQDDGKLVIVDSTNNAIWSRP